MRGSATHRTHFYDVTNLHNDLHNDSIKNLCRCMCVCVCIPSAFSECVRRPRLCGCAGVVCVCARVRVRVCMSERDTQGEREGVSARGACESEGRRERETGCMCV